MAVRNGNAGRVLAWAAFFPDNFAGRQFGTVRDALVVRVAVQVIAHQDDAVETAMRPAQLTRWSPQLWVFSTAGDAKSTYLWRKVLAGRKACEDGTHGRVAYFEYSADEDDDPGDPATWRRTMPALDITITEARVAAEWETAVRKGPDGIALFCRSYLCQWPDVPVLEDVIGEGVLPAALWSAPDPVGCMDEHSQPGRTVVFAVDSDPEQALFDSCGQSVENQAGSIRMLLTVLVLQQKRVRECMSDTIDFQLFNLKLQTFLILII
jgi:hypothetical protein